MSTSGGSATCCTRRRATSSGDSSGTSCRASSRHHRSPRAPSLAAPRTQPPVRRPAPRRTHPCAYRQCSRGSGSTCRSWCSAGSCGSSEQARTRNVSAIWRRGGNVMRDITRGIIGARRTHRASTWSDRRGSSRCPAPGGCGHMSRTTGAPRRASGTGRCRRASGGSSGMRTASRRRLSYSRPPRRVAP